jgi:thiol-disulfide isomerase/thioredoxin
MGDFGQRRPARGNRLVSLLMVALIGGSLYIVVKGVFFPPNMQDMRPPQLRAQDLGPMDLNWRLRQLDGPDFDMAQLKGKVVFLNFWERRCPPCVAEMPSIQRLHQKVEGGGILVLPVFHESPDATRKFLQGHAITMPVYYVEGPLPADVAPDAIPTTYILGRDGRIVYKEVGAARWDDDSVVAFLRDLAAKEAP